ncbi:MAG: HlyD family efflux transporter periplasmic adaptor subunit [Candidatus Brocadiae bacterium]|nr:HlyD family efflux transporter periplasmic adaptor subunit [Candidatus Brocadiia bacterium]
MNQEIVASSVQKDNKGQALDPASILSQIFHFLKTSQSLDTFIEKLLVMLVRLTNASAACAFRKTSATEIVCLQQYFNPACIQFKESILIEIKKTLVSVKEKEKIVLSRIQIHEEKNFYSLLTPFSEEREVSLGILLDISAIAMVEPFMVILQLIAGYSNLYLLQQSNSQGRILAQQTAFIIELVDGAAQEMDIAGASYFFVNQMQQRIGCNQVVLGHIRKNHSYLLAISGMAKYNSRSPVVHAFEKAMEETMREAIPIQFPQPSEKKTLQSDLAHQELAEISQFSTVYSLPLLVQKDMIGVWIFLWKEEHAISTEEKNLTQATSVSIAPLLNVLLKNRKNFLHKGMETCLKLCHSYRFVFFIFLFLSFLWCMTLPFSYDIKAHCKLQPSVRRMVAAPFDGVLLQTYVKQGDVIQKPGHVMALLDGRELRWQLVGLEAERAKILKQSQIALANEKVAEYHISRLEMQNLDVQIKLIQDKLSHLEIRSPIEGIVLTGDLERAHGVPVSTGQALFELAPLNTMLVEIYAEARDIAYLSQGLEGEIQLESIAGKYIPIKIESILPESEVQNTTNVFVCRATIQNADNILQPGMEGTAYIFAGKKPLWWILLHKPIEWIRMELWF